MGTGVRGDWEMKPVGRNKFELDTPCLVLDLDLLDENLQKMQATVAAAGKALVIGTTGHSEADRAVIARARLSGASGPCSSTTSAPPRSAGQRELAR